ncbi:disease resistance protein [Striga asiatica]|uniref:Disease resistance protein n=1 Tax=Striga asiatica TaxID=4170 RepID=A0A5A7QNL9_STRAF|nr:disease resistance protein [Striga asiatica]
MFREDDEISVSRLMSLWVHEGFVKPVAGKSLETTARVVYFNDLVLKNLVVVRGWGCRIHDLLRDLCIKEAEKYKFFRTTHNHPDHDQSWCAQRRISIHQAASERKYTLSLDVLASPLPKAVQSASRARTLILDFDQTLPSFVPFRLLRVLHGYRIGGEFCHMVNLRHLRFKPIKRQELEFSPEFYLLWNLQTLEIYNSYRRGGYAAVLDIWRMTQLRYVMIGRFQLTDPHPKEFENGWMVLENLETLQGVCNLRWSEEVVERIPNIKNLEIEYDELLTAADYDLDNLCRLHKLVSLHFCIFSRKSEVMMRITFPVSLRWLTLNGTRLGWEEMGTTIRSLPHLEGLKIWSNAFVGPEWVTADGEFQSLRYLQISRCSDLEQWWVEATHFPRLESLCSDLEQWWVEATHFPRLESLQILCLDKLIEIPLGIGYINTLMEIDMVYCSDSAVLSAKKILEKQQECFGEVELQIEVSLGSFVKGIECALLSSFLLLLELPELTAEEAIGRERVQAISPRQTKCGYLKQPHTAYIRELLRSRKLHKRRKVFADRTVESTTSDLNHLVVCLFLVIGTVFSVP